MTRLSATLSNNFISPHTIRVNGHRNEFPIVLSALFIVSLVLEYFGTSHCCLGSTFCCCCSRNIFVSERRDHSKVQCDILGTKVVGELNISWAGKIAGLCTLLQFGVELSTFADSSESSGQLVVSNLNITSIFACQGVMS